MDNVAASTYDRKTGNIHKKANFLSNILQPNHKLLIVAKFLGQDCLDDNSCQGTQPQARFNAGIKI